MTKINDVSIWRKRVQEGWDLDDVPFEKCDLAYLHGSNFNSEPHERSDRLSMALILADMKVLGGLFTQPGMHINREPGPNALVEAVARSSRKPLLLFVLGHPGINVNQVDEEHGTALHRAAAKGNLEAMDTLLARSDIDVNLAMRKHGTPLARAARVGRYDSVELLLRDHRVNVNATPTPLSDKCFCQYISPVCAAVVGGNKLIVQLLMTHSAQAGIPMPHKVDSFNLAIAGGRPDIAMYIHGYFDKEDIKCRPETAEDEAVSRGGALFLLLLLVFLVVFVVVMFIMLQGLLVLICDLPRAPCL